MQAPQTAGDLEQFLCAVNRMRHSRIHTHHGSPLRHTGSGGADRGLEKKVKLSRVRLEDVSWGADEVAGVEAVRDALLKPAPLAPPSPTADLCLYPDTSNDYWGAVTQFLTRGAQAAAGGATPPPACVPQRPFLPVQLSNGPPSKKRHLQSSRLCVDWSTTYCRNLV
ncbi:unnamed protein product [Phytophthora fragariaefolia]|uniref:Unnamed protein product n=1 Tax=Phytophthora fragariaefolia TaxID=1490495 RepID=A0A9W6X6D4_9STRA|nr:unnamed protein product [Phytophthora fragariaefolia]